MLRLKPYIDWDPVRRWLLTAKKGTAFLLDIPEGMDAHNCAVTAKVIAWRLGITVRARAIRRRSENNADRKNTEWLVRILVTKNKGKPTRARDLFEATIAGKRIAKPPEAHHAGIRDPRLRKLIHDEGASPEKG